MVNLKAAEEEEEGGGEYDDGAGDDGVGSLMHGNEGDDATDIFFSFWLVNRDCCSRLMLSVFSLDCDDDGFVWSGRRGEEEELHILQEKYRRYNEYATTKVVQLRAQYLSDSL